MPEAGSDKFSAATIGASLGERWPAVAVEDLEINASVGASVVPELADQNAVGLAQFPNLFAWVRPPRCCRLAIRSPERLAPVVVGIVRHVSILSPLATGEVTHPTLALLTPVPAAEYPGGPDRIVGGPTESRMSRTFEGRQIGAGCDRRPTSTL